MNVLVFSIKTIPDIDGGKQIYSLQGLDDKSTSKALFHLRKQQTGSDELPLYLQRIASISIVYRGMGDDMDNEISVRSLGDDNSTEAELLSLFFNEIKERSPHLVSWNGLGFDWALIHYRALKNKVSAPDYWDKINNTFNDDEFHADLQGMLSGYNESFDAPLNHIALMLGFPGNDELDTAQVWKKYLKGDIQAIRNDSEINAMNNYLVYLRVLLMQGEISEEKLTEEFTLLRDTLNQSEEAHLQAFSRLWNQ